MTQYLVNIYREMKLIYTGIEADTPLAAAMLAGDKTTEAADNVEDCNGQNLYAVVEMCGNDDGGQTTSVDFQSEWARKAASVLLAALKAILPYAESEGLSLAECYKRDGEEAAKTEAVACERAVGAAQAAIAEAEAVGVSRKRVEPDIDALLAGRHEIAVTWCTDDVLMLRPDLSQEQAWEVLEQAKHKHDAEFGINWDALACHADHLFGYAPRNGGGIAMDAIETETVERDGHAYRITIYPDGDSPNPLEDWCEMGIILSLNRRHGNFDPAGVEAAIDGNPDAVPLSYFEHGLCLWSVAGELPAGCRCPWDSVPFAGVWLPDAGTLASAGNYGGRTRRHFMRKRARQACAAYTGWCNGEVYGYEIERVTGCPCCGKEDAEPVESCWGFYGLDDCLGEARAIVAAQDRLAA